MGKHTYATVLISNPRKPNLNPIEVRCMADTGALMMGITETITVQLQLDELEKRTVAPIAIGAGGTTRQVPFVRPIRIDFENRFCFTGAFVLGNQPLLRAVPMEEMDLVVHPSIPKVMPNPAYHNIKKYIMYWFFG